MLFDTFCFKNLLLTYGKVHIEKMIFFSIFLDPPIFAMYFLPSAARSLKRTKKHRWIEKRFLGPLGPFWGWRGSKFRFQICVTKQQVLPRVVCLCGAVGVCGECCRVGHVVINFTPEGIFDQKGSKIVVFRPNSSFPIKNDNLKEKWNPDAPNAGKKRWFEISGPAGHPVE